MIELVSLLSTKKTWNLIYSPFIKLLYFAEEKVVYKIRTASSFMIFFLDNNLFSSVAQLCPTLCDPMNHSTPGLPVHLQLPEFTQTHAHWVSDAIQPSHPLSSPSPPAPDPS